MVPVDSCWLRGRRFPVDQGETKVWVGPTSRSGSKGKGNLRKDAGEDNLNEVNSQMN